MKRTISLLIISFCIVFTSIMVYAADETEIIDFQKVIVEVTEDGDGIAIKNLDEYAGRGIIDGIYGRRIVISDRSHNFSSELLVKNMKGEELSLYQVKAGMSVYFSLDTNNTIYDMLVE